jgi:hypothetical protein
VRQMWAELVNRQLEKAHRPERVDHRSLAAQRQEALQRGDQQKAAELDRVPQVKLGSKVVQMERRGVPSDRGNQLREVQEENRQRQALVLEIGELRERVQPQRQPAIRRFRRLIFPPRVICLVTLVHHSTRPQRHGASLQRSSNPSCRRAATHAGHYCQIEHFCAAILAHRQRSCKKLL